MEAMKRSVREKVPEKVKNKISFGVQDATNLAYESGSFDVVVIANALHIMSESDAALQEIHRVLKADGILFAPTFVYEKGYSKLLIRVMETVGFKTYHKWQKNDFAEYVGSFGFDIENVSLVKGKPLQECVLVGRKREV